MLICLMSPASLAAAQTPITTPMGDEWWTAWSTCDITPVQSGPTPENIPGMADNISWLEAEPTNGTDIDMIVWLWTGNRPLPLNGQYAIDGTSTKWLWAFSEAMRDISVTVTSETGAEGEVQFDGAIIGSSTGPINGWPSGVLLPEPGCWTFDITATALDGDIYEGRLIFPAVP
jgi:hypothetical protein